MSKPKNQIDLTFLHLDFICNLLALGAQAQVDFVIWVCLGLRVFAGGNAVALKG